jgi:hypothetical protein
MAASNSPTLLASEKTVATAGQAEALFSSSQRVRSLTIIAKSGNTGQVYIGGSDVASTTNDGLASCGALEIPTGNWLDLSDIYIDVDVNGEGVDFYAVKA